MPTCLPRRRAFTSGPPIAARAAATPTPAQQKAHHLRPPAADRGTKFVHDSPLEEAGFEPSVPGESNGEKAKEPVSLVERKVPEMSSTGRRLSIFTSGFSRD